MYSYALPSTAANPQQTVNYYCLTAYNASNNVVATAVISDLVSATNGLSIYPNPVDNVLHIKGLEASKNYKLNIVNEQGNVISTTTINNAAVYNFNVKGLSKGVYHLTIASSNKTIFSTKFLKE